MSSPERQRHDLGIEGWTYMSGRNFVGYGYTLHGYRADNPAPQPHVTAWRPDLETALADLRTMARAFDEERQGDDAA